MIIFFIIMKIKFQLDFISLAKDVKLNWGKNLNFLSTGQTGLTATPLTEILINRKISMSPEIPLNYTKIWNILLNFGYHYILVNFASFCSASA